MKRFLLVLLALLLMLAACDKKEEAASFLQTDNGYGCTDTKTGIHYTAMPLAFEPAGAGAVRGVYAPKDAEYTLTYYEIPSVDPTKYIGDGEMGVWYATEGVLPPAAKDLTVTAIIVCEEQAVSAEVYRFAEGKDDAVINEIRTLWFEGAAVDKPEGARSFTRRLKLASAELPGIYYCFDYCIFGENAYFYELFSGRTVAVPASLAEKFVEN